MTKVSEDQMQPGTGLLPTAAVDAARASKSVTGDSQTLAGSDMYSVMVAGHHDKEYYDKWNKDRQEAIARGEDPNAKFLALVKEKEQQGYQGKIRRFFKRLSGSNASGHPVIGDETPTSEETTPTH